jgi:murein L,D-transpeptidase YafK
VRVIKSSYELQLLANNKIIKTYTVALGSNPDGHKQKSGDGRTPEGSYVLDFKKADSAFHKAIHISYPNAKDVQQAQKHGPSPGGDIMVHGQKNGLG